MSTIFELENSVGGPLTQPVLWNSNSVENEFSKSLWPGNSTEEKYWLNSP